MKKIRVYLENTNEELELVKALYGANLSKAVTMLVKEVFDGVSVKTDVEGADSQGIVYPLCDNGSKRSAE